MGSDIILRYRPLGNDTPPLKCVCDEAEMVTEQVNLYKVLFKPLAYSCQLQKGQSNKGYPPSTNLTPALTLFFLLCYIISEGLIQSIHTEKAEKGTLMTSKPNQNWKEKEKSLISMCKSLFKPCCYTSSAHRQILKRENSLEEDMTASTVKDAK